MKILVVSPFLPYSGVPHAGGKLVYFLLGTLTRNHSVSLVSRYFPEETRHVEQLKKMLSRVELVAAPGPIEPGDLSSLWTTALSYRRLAAKAAEVLGRERFDVCQVEFTETGVFWDPSAGVPAVLTCHDIIAKPEFRQWESSRGVPKILHRCTLTAKRAMEKKALSKFSSVFTLSEEDRRWGERFYPGIPFRVLRYPGGVGFTGLPHREVAGRILFLGALNRPQNVESVRYLLWKVWPEVRERAPGAEFRVVGSGLPRSMERELLKDPRIVLTGFVDDIETEYASAAICVAPILTGGGIIVKILDALAAGVPVVTTPYGNEGIGATAGKEILVGDDPRSFTAHVLSLLEDPGLRDSLGQAGKRFAERNFSPGLFAAVLEETYDGLVR